jgi:hypothetical protein
MSADAWNRISAAAHRAATAAQRAQDVISAAADDIRRLYENDPAWRAEIDVEIAAMEAEDARQDR